MERPNLQPSCCLAPFFQQLSLLFYPILSYSILFSVLYSIGCAYSNPNPNPNQGALPLLVRALGLALRLEGSRSQEGTQQAAELRH